MRSIAIAELYRSLQALWLQAIPHRCDTRLSNWQKGEKKPGYLATQRLAPRQVVRLYRRRMWREELFGDLKQHGFDLEASHLRHFLRLSRRTLALCLPHLWLVAMAAWVVTTDQTDQLDRHDRRDLMDKSK